ncbi:hypothetical protein XM38_039960 [Halomicronema hongdechloris C2206]|uniref:Uncharacterized protein n=1 Tax=Halomicronema hongdechloris C2206 TaxID=1641165 RepID=A0A1Z3HRS9_9CYAN|nr:hypothetical protein [Halomicronema hongdechloris]ASC73034.1 hypothetical protein XM38_039960 [Halomicronema hongdechloris C2206]
MTRQDYENRAEELAEVFAGGGSLCLDWQLADGANCHRSPGGHGANACPAAETGPPFGRRAAAGGKTWKFAAPASCPWIFGWGCVFIRVIGRKDIRLVLEQEFSQGYTPDGRLAFFQSRIAGLWATPLYASQIAGRIQAVSGIDQCCLH